MPFETWHSQSREAPIRVPAIGLELTVRLPSEASGHALTVIDTINAPGFGPPLHRHPEVEIFRVLSGRYLFEVDGRRFFAETGDVVSVPGGAAHAFINVTSQPAQQTITIVPAFDAVAFFTGLGELMKDGVPDKDALNAFGRLWRMEFLGPPLSA
jgi:quercetin dioxygenase-like cupin family protein